MAKREGLALLVIITAVAIVAIMFMASFLLEGKVLGTSIGSKATVGRAIAPLGGDAASGGASSPPLPLTVAGQTMYVYSGGLIASIKNSETTYYMQDFLSSNRMSTNAAGTMQSKSVSYPYGKTLSLQSYASSKPKYLFTGKELDDSKYYFGARYMDPRTGRFTSVDPITRTGTNYAYGADNPMKFVDPTGMDDAPVKYDPVNADIQRNQEQNDAAISMSFRSDGTYGVGQIGLDYNIGKGIGLGIDISSNSAHDPDNKNTEGQTPLRNEGNTGVVSGLGVTQGTGMRVGVSVSQQFSMLGTLVETTGSYTAPVRSGFNWKGQSSQTNPYQPAISPTASGDYTSQAAGLSLYAQRGVGKNLAVTGGANVQYSRTIGKTSFSDPLMGKSGSQSTRFISRPQFSGSAGIRSGVNPYVNSWRMSGAVTYDGSVGAYASVQTPKGYGPLPANTAAFIQPSWNDGSGVSAAAGVRIN